MSTMLTDEKKLKKVKIAIYTAAIAIPLVVAVFSDIYISF